MFYLLTRFFNWFKPYYRYYIEHSISNLNYLVYLGSIVFLTIDAIQAQDIQGVLELGIYTMMFGAGSFLMELTHGVGAMKNLD